MQTNESRRRFLATGLKIAALLVPAAAALVGKPQEADASVARRRYRRRRRY